MLPPSSPPPEPASRAPVGDGLATLGQRFGALVIDGFISWFVLTTGFIAAAAVAATNLPERTFDNPDPGPTGVAALVTFLFGALGVVATLVYYVALEGRPQGQTLGKMAMGIRVVRRSDGAPLGYGLAIVRTLSRFLDAITVVPLGLLWAIWDRQHQTWHDKIAGTVVVRRPPPTKAGTASSGSRTAPPANPFRTG
jgi:uncharacterized RDD family membrane protein YckC